MDGSGINALPVKAMDEHGVEGLCKPIVEVKWLALGYRLNNGSLTSSDVATIRWCSWGQKTWRSHASKE